MPLAQGGNREVCFFCGPLFLRGNRNRLDGHMNDSPRCPWWEVNGYRLRTSGKVESFHSENGCHACHQIPSAFPERLFFIIPKSTVFVGWFVRPLLDSSIGHGEPINARPTFQSPFESVGVALAVPSFFDLGSGTVATGQCKSPLTPLRKCAKLNGEVYAYSFCRGASNLPCPLLHKLKEMQLLSPEHTKHKYENTIRFLEKHWRIVQS
jgi:hypothetical protein